VQVHRLEIQSSHAFQYIVQVAQLSQTDGAAWWVSFDQNISGRRYSATDVVGARKLEALIFYTLSKQRHGCIMNA